MIILSRALSMCSTLFVSQDLSDSTVLRNVGVGFAHCLIAYKSTIKGISKLDADGKAMAVSPRELACVFVRVQSRSCARMLESGVV